MICKECHSDVSEEALFCPKCGKSLYEDNGTDAAGLKLTSNKKIHNKKGIIILLVILATAVCAGAYFYKEANASPIQGVSKQTYINGMNFLDEINSDSYEQEVTETLAKALNEEGKWDTFDDIYNEKINSICKKKNKSKEEKMFVDAIIITYDYHKTALVQTIFAKVLDYELMDPIFSGIVYNTLIDKNSVDSSAEGIAALRSNDIDRIEKYVNQNREHLMEIENEYKQEI